MRCLNEMGEFGFIDRLARIIPTSPTVVEGIGDDCAVLRAGERLLLVSTDMFIEDIHFRREGVSPRDIGWKAASACLSDIAAMGGAPMYCLTSLACTGDETGAFLEEVYRGMLSAMSRFGTVIVGGDTTRSPGKLIIDVVAVGEAVGGRFLRRRGAKVGDVLGVTGSLGCSAAGLHALTHGIACDELVQTHMYPSPRILEGQWLCARDTVHAMIDVSDGLCQDSGHLAKAVRLGVDLHPDRLPVTPALAKYCSEHELDPVELILTGGEDYELLFATDAKTVDKTMEAFHHEFRVPTTVIGTVTDDWTGIRVNGVTPEFEGYDHFKPQKPEATA